MDYSLLLPLILQLAGAAVIIAEIVLPSGGILTVLAVGLFGFSLYRVFSSVSAAAGIIFIIADIIIIPVIIYFGLKLLAKSPVTLSSTLSGKLGVTSQSPELEKYLGMEGIALTDLRPSGIARINDQRVDVITRGDYIEKSSSIIVQSVTGNQIIVRKK
jgi:membrane-bound ClpP family serine protease